MAQGNISFDGQFLPGYTLQLENTNHPGAVRLPRLLSSVLRLGRELRFQGPLLPRQLWFTRETNVIPDRTGPASEHVSHQPSASTTAPSSINYGKPCLLTNLSPWYPTLLSSETRGL